MDCRVKPGNDDKRIATRQLATKKAPEGAQI
jgi:hypothetical protein